MGTDISLVSLLPPLLVLVLGYLTHRVMLSLSAGIFLAALIAANFAPLATIQSIANTLWVNLELSNLSSATAFWHSSNLFIFIFLLVLGVFVTMLQISGGAYAYGIFAKRKIKSAKNAETSSMVLSTGLFVDDYLSSLTVGSVMYPLTDTQKIPRIKLAYLVDSMAAPLAVLCPFSSWVAAIMGFLGENGIRETETPETLILANPFTTFINIIPFIFYSFVLVAVTWFIVRKRISFGLMRKHELIAIETGNLFGGAKPPVSKGKKIEHNPHHTTLLEFFLPIGLLLVCVLSGILYSGDWWVFGGNNSLLVACQNSSGAMGVFLGGTITMILCTIFFVLRDRIEIKQIPAIYWDGIKLMFPAVLVLLLAWTLGDFLRNQLHTGEYLASLMLGSLNITLLPMILFFVACLIAFTIGSAWGTAAMLFPIAIPLVLSMVDAPQYPTLAQVPIIFPVLGAVLAGCIAGNHISPIADTTIMSTMSTQAKLKDHVHSQIQYAIPGIICSGLAFLLSASLLQYGTFVATVVPILAAICTNMLILWLLTRSAICKAR